MEPQHGWLSIGYIGGLRRYELIGKVNMRFETAFLTQMNADENRCFVIT